MPVTLCAMNGEPMPEHRYDEQFQELQDDVIRLAALTCEAIAAGTNALLDFDFSVADQVVADDRAIDQLTVDAETKAYRLLALQQPMGRDLRVVLAIMRILQEIELAADLMVAVAKAARRIYPGELPPRVRGIVDRMGQQASTQFRAAVDAFADRDLARAAALEDMDDVMDDLQRELLREILTGGAPDEAALQMAVELGLIGRYYERVADHAVDVADWTTFMITGDVPQPPWEPEDGGIEAVFATAAHAVEREMTVAPHEAAAAVESQEP